MKRVLEYADKGDNSLRYLRIIEHLDVFARPKQASNSEEYPKSLRDEAYESPLYRETDFIVDASKISGLETTIEDLLRFDSNPLVDFVDRNPVELGRSSNNLTYSLAA